MFPSIYDILIAVHHEMEIREWAENLIKKSKSTELDEAIKGLRKIKNIAKAKKLGAVYEIAERTLAKIGEKKRNEIRQLNATIFYIVVAILFT